MANLSRNVPLALTDSSLSFASNKNFSRSSSFTRSCYHVSEGNQHHYVENDNLLGLSNRILGMAHLPRHAIT